MGDYSCIKTSLLSRRGASKSPQALSITASLFPSPPLFAMLTSFQFTQSALPTRLAALFPCDSRRPIAAQAHLVPCEAEASLHYITAATGCHGNAHGHYHTLCVCVHAWWFLCVFVGRLNGYSTHRHWEYVNVLGCEEEKSISKNKKLITKDIVALFWDQCLTSWQKPCDTDLCYGSSIETDDLSRFS